MSYPPMPTEELRLVASLVASHAALGTDGISRWFIYWAGSINPMMVGFVHRIERPRYLGPSRPYWDRLPDH